MRVSVLSNINVDSLLKNLAKQFDCYFTDGYNMWIKEICDQDSDFYNYRSQIVFLLFDGTELLKNITSIKEAEKEIDIFFDYIETLAQKCSYSKIFVSNLDIYNLNISNIKEINNEVFYEAYWTKKIMALNNFYNNVFLFDLKTSVISLGREAFYSFKMWYMGSIKYSAKGEKMLLEEIKTIINSLTSEKKKCLILDLDNTLWGGVVGELGINNIELSENGSGARYKDFQKRLKELKNLGVMLAVCSKNNYNDAIEVIKNHPHMILREDDFVSLKINWESKYKNILNISEDLNIGISSMVFIDDNPVERESVKSFIQEIHVPDFPKDTSTLQGFLLGIYKHYFFKINLTEEDKNKTESYIQNKKRTELLAKSTSYEDFLLSLNTKIYVTKNNINDVQRIAQLTQKTNQFNLTGKVYNDFEVTEFIKNKDYLVYSARVEDKFGDNGKVIVMLVKILNDEEAEIDTFLMSCRVMGRKIEEQFLNFIEEDLRNIGIGNIISHYNSTKKNIPVKDLFDNLGYIKYHEDLNGNKSYSLNLRNIVLKRCCNGELFIET